MRRSRKPVYVQAYRGFESPPLRPDTSVSVIDGAACNGQHTSGCSRTPRKIAVGDYPGSIAVDSKAGTAYVSTPEGVPVIPVTR
jgi:DNA-binding beta-propeller fold protein YncE